MCTTRHIVRSDNALCATWHTVDASWQPVVPAEVQLTKSRLKEAKLLVCIRMDCAQEAFEVAKALLDVGTPSVEITLTTPDAVWVLERLAREYPHALLGAGSVLNLDHVDRLQSCGVKYVMSPVLPSAAFVRECHARELLCIPGAATPTEVFQAHDVAGAQLVKLFPTSLSLIKSLSGPLGHIPLVPTSGVQLDQVSEHLTQPNVWMIGASRQILQPTLLQEHNWNAIQMLAQRWIYAVANILP